MASYYDPSTYPQGVPNPYGIMVHAWKGGPLNEGTRYHGPVYTRPDYRLPFQPRPLWGFGSLLGLGATDTGCGVGKMVLLAGASFGLGYLAAMYFMEERLMKEKKDSFSAGVRFSAATGAGRD